LQSLRAFCLKTLLDTFLNSSIQFEILRKLLITEYLFKICNLAILMFNLLLLLFKFEIRKLYEELKKSLLRIFSGMVQVSFLIFFLRQWAFSKSFLKVWEYSSITFMRTLFLQVTLFYYKRANLSKSTSICDFANSIFDHILFSAPWISVYDFFDIRSAPTMSFFLTLCRLKYCR
jgi:hypothetical protein